MCHGGLNRARSWKRRIQPKKAYSSSGLLYSDVGIIREQPTRLRILRDESSRSANCLWSGG
jgi:hypothetical protein